MKSALRLLFLFSVICFLGCSDGRPERVPVSGKVTIDGSPVTKGTVMFISAGSRAAIGEIQSDGSFKLFTYEPNDGCIPGSYRISIMSSDSSAASITNLIPKKYFNHKTSGITQEIVGPKDNLVFALEWDGEKPFTEIFEPEE